MHAAARLGISSAAWSSVSLRSLLGKRPHAQARGCWGSSAVCCAVTSDPVYAHRRGYSSNSESKEIDYADYCRGVTTTPCRLRQMTTLLSKAPPDLINLAPGFPNPDTFPYTSISATLRDGTTLTLEKDLLSKALEYAPTHGIDPLVNWLLEFQRRVHRPPRAMEEPDSFSLIITNGCTEGMQTLVDILLQSGDPIFIEDATFSTMLTSLTNRGLDVVGVEGDGDGMIPDSLRARLEEAHTGVTGRVVFGSGIHVPRVLYIVPSGANPTGGTLTLERKRDIYQIAQEYDLLIIEDDPYYFITYEDELIPSLQSMDVDGRVLRCDSFSKIIAPGLRLGFLSGPSAIVDRVTDRLTTMSNSNGPLAQHLLFETLKHMGYDGFSQHMQFLRDFYKPRRDKMADILNKYMKDHAEWTVPHSGMFFWLKLKHIRDTRHLIFEHAIEQKVLLVPGEYFVCSPDAVDNCPYLRVCFSFSSEERMEKGIRRLAHLVEMHKEK